MVIKQNELVCYCHRGMQLLFVPPPKKKKLCGQNVEFLNIKRSSTKSNHLALKG